MGRDNIISTPKRTSSRTPHHKGHRDSVSLNSYTDGVNPLIFMSNRTPKEHRKVVDKVDRILEEEVAEDQLKWDSSKDSRFTFFSPKDQKELTLTLSIHINGSLNFQP